jgi:hypothetical protein
MSLGGRPAFDLLDWRSRVFALYAGIRSAYSPEWTCPLAPPGNVLDVALPGGERVAADAGESAAS